MTTKAEDFPVSSRQERLLQLCYLPFSRRPAEGQHWVNNRPFK